MQSFIEQNAPFAPKEDSKRHRKYHDHIFRKMSNFFLHPFIFLLCTGVLFLVSPTSGIKLVLRAPWNCWSFGAKKPAKLRTLTCRLMLWWMQPRRPGMAMLMNWCCGVLAIKADDNINKIIQNPTDPNSGFHELNGWRKTLKISRRIKRMCVCVFIGEQFGPGIDWLVKMCVLVMGWLGS